MSRVFWDTMMFLYLLDEHPTFEPEVRRKLERSYSRGDSLVTSYLALGELMAGTDQSSVKRDAIRNAIINLGFSFLSFDGACPAIFAKLRFASRLKAPDAIHLACAAAAGVDMYLTGDAQLLHRGLHVPGIQFIADFTLPVL